jgi:hypothetical protein
MQSFVDFFESKPFTALLVGAVSLGIFAQMDNDWHSGALSLVSMATYWSLFSERR